MFKFHLVLLATVAYLCPVQSFAQTCVDNDGDGWGWDGSSSCLAGSMTPPASQLGCIDSDGDGWGWDGHNSCVVEAMDSPDPTPSSGASCIDTDGDGWGWNGTDSCQVNGSDANTSIPNNTAPQANLPRGRYDRQTDLIALHYDHAPDPDDGHAAAAGYVIHDSFNLPVVVVGGTYGEYSASQYVRESENLMRRIWGQQWLDAHNHRLSAVEQAARRWVGALSAGGDVWIAEGGPSDFTAAVVRMIRQQYPEYNTRDRVHVVQHSVWNEDHASRQDLNYVRSNTDYIRIEDGNDPNATADLRQENGSAFVRVALSSQYSEVWRVAFNYLNPEEKLDFSDTVEVLYILNIGTSEISDADAFGRYFLR